MFILEDSQTQKWESLGRFINTADRVTNIRAESENTVRLVLLWTVTPLLHVCYWKKDYIHTNKYSSAQQETLVCFLMAVGFRREQKRLFFLPEQKREQEVACRRFQDTLLTRKPQNSHLRIVWSPTQPWITSTALLNTRCTASAGSQCRTHRQKTQDCF